MDCLRSDMATLPGAIYPLRSNRTTLEYRSGEGLAVRVAPRPSCGTAFARWRRKPWLAVGHFLLFFAFFFFVRLSTRLALATIFS